ncbi:MAG: NAD-dependent epimerase/dehydratase family protein [Candidatus Methylomirabilales bacterium]
MSIWVTGCGGFLGKRLVRALTSGGHKVVALSRRVCPFGDGSISIDLSSDGICRQLEELSRDFGYPDVVVHAASRKPGPYSISEYIKSNVLSTANLLDALKKFPPRQLVYTSTLSVYGRPDTIPVKETHPLRGNFPYAVTKRCGEQLLEGFQDRSQVIILRLPSLYGVGQSDSFVDGIARLAIRNETIELFSRGETVRDALHVDDVIKAIISCVTYAPRTQFCCMNLGCGKRITTREYVQALLQALEISSPVVPVGRPSPQEFDLYADIEEARRQIGFTPTALILSMKRYADELRA